MKIIIHFEKQYGFFIKKNKNYHPFEYIFARRASVKDIIESHGVPHTEVGKIDFNHQEVDFSYIPLSQGRLHVSAILPPFDVLSPSVLRPKPFNRMKFIADVNVIRLGRLLILLGFDVRYSSSYSDKEIADISKIESRIVLTRDTDLLKRNKVIFAKLIRAVLPYDQLVETIIYFGLQNQISFFSRCTECNIKLIPKTKKSVLDFLEPKTKLYFNTFFQCPVCKNVFWRGSHYDNLKQKISALGISINH